MQAHTLSRLALTALGLCLVAGLEGLAVPAGTNDLATAAREFRVELAAKVLPYWYDRCVDWQRGGYVLSDDAAKPAPPATEKMIVTQVRMIWGFSHAYLKGFRDPQRDYLKAARQGYEFLQKRFLDPLNGGYYWRTDLEGKPVNDRKYLYGESFVIYAFVEYHRASGDPQPLRDVLELYRVVQKRCHDAANGGWGEHYTRDWKLLTQQNPRIEVEVAGLKSANAHLHWMEALAELYDATRDPDVKRSLIEALEINQRQFYPKAPGKACFHKRPDWGFVTDPKSAGVSYGHNVEFAWLMIRAEEVLGRQPSWDHFDAVINHALKYGTDPVRGGLYNRGFDDQPATDTDKVWWSQSEWMAALTDGLKHRDNPAWRDALAKLVAFLRAYQINPADGIWLDTVTTDGKPKSAAKAHNWKANYHDVRGLVKFCDAFAPPPPGAK
jgi:mannobiose 2-epimerase